jgi:hypothetical protein
MGEHAAALIDATVVEVATKRVVCVVCPMSDTPIYLRTKQSPEEEFYVRAGPGSVKMPISEALQFIKRRFAS